MTGPRFGSAPNPRRVVLLAALLSLVSIPLSSAEVPSGQRPPSFPKFDPESSREYVQTVLRDTESGATDADTCYLVARSRSQLGEQAQAEQWARRAIEFAPKRTDILSFLADLLILQDRLDEAAGLLNQAVALAPDLASAQRRLGMVLDRLGDRDGARRAFATAAQHGPNDPTTRLLFGQNLLEQGDLKRALEELGAACRLDTNSARAFYLLSQAQTQAGDTNSAARSVAAFQELKRAERVAYDAKNAGYRDSQAMLRLAVALHRDLAEVWVRQAQLPLAEAHLRQAIALDPQDVASGERLVVLLIRMGRLDEARIACARLVELAPNEPSYHLNLGVLLARLNQGQAAAVEFKRVLELDATQPQALYNLARYYLTTRQELPQALALAKQLVARHPDGESYDLLGWACYANGLTNQARAAAATAVERDPTNRDYRQRLERLGGAPTGKSESRNPSAE